MTFSYMSRDASKLTGQFNEDGYATSHQLAIPGELLAIGEAVLYHQSWLPGIMLRFISVFLTGPQLSVLTL